MAVALAAIVGAAFAVRVLPARETVFRRDGEVRLFDTDSYYHLRQARRVAEHFPRVERHDLAVYPDGQRALYAGLHDMVIAAGAKIAGSVERSAAWTPAVLGAAAFVALFWLGWAAQGAGTGLLAGVLLLLAPGFFIARSLLGYADHHVSEVLLGVATAAGLTRCLQTTRWPWWRPAALHALPLSLFLFTWYGAPIYVILCALTLFVVASVQVARGEVPDGVAKAATRHALGVAVVVGPAALVFPWLVMEPRTFRLVLVALAAVAAGMPLHARLVRVALARKLPPLGLALGGLALVVGGGALAARLSPVLAGQLLGVKSELVAEQLGLGAGELLRLGGAPMLLAILALPLALVEAWRGRDERFALAPVLLGSMMVALWLRAHDYAYAAPPYLALMAALVLVRAARRALWPTVVAGLVAVVAPIWPLRWVEPPVPSAGTVRALVLLDDAWADTLRWIKERTPPGRYGVRAYWDFGHFVAELAERPVLATGAISRSLAAWYVGEDEEAALRASREIGDVRYVIADAQSAGSFFQSTLKMVGADVADYRDSRPNGMWVYNERFQRTMISRLFDLDGDGLSHYRMVYATRARSALGYVARMEGSELRVARRTTPLTSAERVRQWEALARRKEPTDTPFGTVYNVGISPSVKVFEEVQGARLVGTAAPGAFVEASLVLRAMTAGHTVHWHRSATADGAGRFEIIVPYPTEADSASDLVAEGPYKVRSGTVTARAPVRVADVHGGATVSVAPAP